MYTVAVDSVSIMELRALKQAGLIWEGKTFETRQYAQDYIICLKGIAPKAKFFLDKSED